MICKRWTINARVDTINDLQSRDEQFKRSLYSLACNSVIIQRDDTIHEIVWAELVLTACVGLVIFSYIKFIKGGNKSLEISKILPENPDEYSKIQL